jgi:hypothetical protein
MLEQHRPGDDLVRMPHQILKKAEFTRLEVDLPVAAAAAATGGVQFEVADAEQCARLC